MGAVVMSNKNNELVADDNGSASDFERIVMCCYPNHCKYGDTCWCEPEIETINDIRIIVHREIH